MLQWNMSNYDWFLCTLYHEYTFKPNKHSFNALYNYRIKCLKPYSHLKAFETHLVFKPHKFMSHNIHIHIRNEI
jgi:hypothetical protein